MSEFEILDPGKRNRLFITAQTSIYAIYVVAQGALRPLL
jgi:hypothetical protein